MATFRHSAVGTHVADFLTYLLLSYPRVLSSSGHFCQLTEDSF